MKSANHADVEATKLRSLLARRHGHTSHFGQVVVSGGAWRLSRQAADWRDIGRDEEGYEIRESFSPLDG